MGTGIASKAPMSAGSQQFYIGARPVNISGRMPIVNAKQAYESQIMGRPMGTYGQPYIVQGQPGQYTHYNSAGQATQMTNYPVRQTRPPGMTAEDWKSQYPQDIPEYEIPERDERRLNFLTRQAAAPHVRSLRSQVQRAMAGSFENPNVKRITLRDALAGYGEGLENVMGGAAETAERQYAGEYAPMLEKSKAMWGAEVQRQQNAYQAAFDLWRTQRELELKRYEIESDQSPMYL